MPLEVAAIAPANWGIDPRTLERNIRKAIEQTMGIVDNDYRRTYRTWRNKPQFRKKRPSLRRGRLEGQVTTKSKQYRFVDLGTRPHIIRPKRPGGRLKFGTKGGRAKTTPGVVGSRAGRRAGSPTAFAKQVRHPGTKARKFTVTIVQRRSRNARNLARNALLKSLARPPKVKT